MTKHEFVKWVRQITKGCIKWRRICQVLEIYGFKLVGAGAHKRAFLHKNYPQWVVKVFDGPTIWYYCHSTTGIIPKPLQPFWLKNIYVCRRFIIQPYANGKGGTNREAYKALKEILGKGISSKYDLFECNVRYHDGNPVIIDFAHYNITKKEDKACKFRQPRITPRAEFA